MIKQGTYKPFIQGVSQQTIQERQDGQLNLQVNMLSDPVTGLRRRSGTEFLNYLTGVTSGSYINNVYISGKHYIITIQPTEGVLRLHSSNGVLVYESEVSEYLKGGTTDNIRLTVARDNIFIVNTSKVPKATYYDNTTNPNRKGYFGIVGTALSKKFRITLEINNVRKTVAYTTPSDQANGSYPNDVARALMKAIQEDTDLNSKLDCYIRENVVCLYTKVGYILNDVDTDSSETYVLTSGSGYLLNKSKLISKLHDRLNDYIMGVGVEGNRSYFKYNYATNTWTECGKWGDGNFTVTDEPVYVYYDKDGFHLTGLGIKGRIAGDSLNNPLPKFLGFGITGISSYQSRLLLLSGSYVNFSKSNEFNSFLRTTVEEVKDDDAIEVGSASLSSTQFEYAIPYNKDLMLIAQDQQAVIPSNNTVLTPKNAVVYPSSNTDLSLKVQPIALSRSLYYVYQRGSEYYQVGELIPNSYADAQYFSQGLTDHIPLYAKGLCTHIAGSTTNNFLVFTSDTTEVLIHQFLWSGDTRPHLAFHKWILPNVVRHTFVLGDKVVFVIDHQGKLAVVATDVKVNQLATKPQPYLDLHYFVDIVDGAGKLPEHLEGLDVVGVIYDHATLRHKEVHISVDGGVVKCPYNGKIVLGIRYTSSFGLTPPFLKDENGNTIAGIETQLKDLTFTFKDSGDLNYIVQDQYGVANKQSTTALIWSQAELEHTWIGSQVKVQVDCRTDLASTNAEISTESTTELNPINTTYILKVARKHR